MEKPVIKRLRSTRNSITVAWERHEHPDLAYTVQVEDRTYCWTSKYWGLKTEAEITGLGPEELYVIRVGVSLRLSDDHRSQEIWSDSIVAATQFDHPWTFYLFQDVHNDATANVVAYSQKRGSFLDVYNKYGDTPLTLAIREGKTGTLNTLLNNGADICQPAQALRKTPLMVACFGGYRAAAEALTRRGVDWNMVDSNMCQALHYAVDGCQMEMVRYGIEQGADVNAQDKFGWTPLMRAVLIGCQLPIIALLIDNGADLNLRDKNKMRVLDLAQLLHEEPELVELLKNHMFLEEEDKEKDDDKSEEGFYFDPEDEQDVEARKEEEDEKTAAQLMKKIDYILNLPTEDDKLPDDEPEQFDPDDEGANL